MTKRTPRGPVAHRMLVLVFSVVFGLLFYWLLGFVISDIGSQPGPDRSELEERLLDRDLVQTATSLGKQIEEANRQINELKSRQQLLKDSIDNSTRTMDQLLEIQRLSLERDSDLPNAAQSAMSENIQLFLSNQQQYQTFNDEVSQRNEQLIGLEQRQRENNQLLDKARRPIFEQYRWQLERHNLWMAGLKLAVLVPLLLIVLVLFLKQRGSAYVPLIYAATIAVAAKVMLVMHQHFPEEYFKYILILVLLAAVTWILIYLLRMVASPGTEWLLKQYRDAYEAFLCPVCNFPIRRGPLKYMSWNRRTIRKATQWLTPSDSTARDEAYTCPMCGTHLFEPCGQCETIRHSLLPACANCGATKPVGSEA